MDKMHVDQPAGPSSSKHSSPISSTASSSSEKRAKLILPQDQLTMVRENMAHYSRDGAWKQIIQMASVEDTLWPNLIIPNILMSITQELAQTDMRGGVIADVTISRAMHMVKSFSKEELEQWKTGIRNGVETGDWSSIIEHPTLENPNMPRLSGLLNPQIQWKGVSTVCALVCFV